MYPDFGYGGITGISIEGTGLTQVIRRGGVLHSFMQESDVTTLNYGEVGYYGESAFVSEQGGLTVWNVSSGNGAFLNKTGCQLFEK